MDWTKLIKELIKAGLTQKEVAIYAGVTQPMISNLMHGHHSNIAYEAGAKLVELHKQVTNKQAEPA